MPQSVKKPTLDLSSVDDLRVVRSSPMSGSMLSMKPTWDSLSPSSSAPPHPSHVLSLEKKIIKIIISLRRSQVPNHYTIDPGTMQGLRALMAMQSKTHI